MSAENLAHIYYAAKLSFNDLSTRMYRVSCHGNVVEADSSVSLFTSIVANSLLPVRYLLPLIYFRSTCTRTKYVYQLLATSHSNIKIWLVFSVYFIQWKMCCGYDNKPSRHIKCSGMHAFITVTEHNSMILMCLTCVSLFVLSLDMCALATLKINAIQYFDILLKAKCNAYPR